MQVLYDIFIVLLNLGIKVFSRFNKKASLLYIGRKNTFNLISQKISDADKVIWMHCASLGEFEQGKPVFEALKQKYPTHKFALSFFSSSGYEARKNYPLADIIFYLPADYKKNAKKLIKQLNPTILILVKYDFWYNLLSELYVNKIPVVLISAIFRPNQIYFSIYGKWFLNKLKGISHFFVQNKETQLLLAKNEIKQTIISGDTRYDAVRNFNKKNAPLNFLDTFCSNYKTVVVGSSWEKDQAFWTKYINEELPADIKIIIAPHEINKKKLDQLRANINKKTIFYTDITTKESSTEKLKQANIFILDTVGLLTKVYAYATIAYIGGGLNKGGVHNVLEPAAYGIPVIYGPNHIKYQEAIDLVNCGGGFVIKNYTELQNTVNAFLTNQIKLNEAGENSFSLIKNAPQATKIIIENLQAIYKDSI